MLFFNLFAQLILIIAAWIATWDEPAFLDLDESRVRFALTAGPAGRTEHRRRCPRRSAVRTVRIGLGAGWVTGAATGLGLGAILAWLVGDGRSAVISGRRPSR